MCIPLGLLWGHESLQGLQTCAITEGNKRPRLLVSDGSHKPSNGDILFHGW
jgi:hypothetical protein